MNGNKYQQNTYRHYENISEQSHRLCFHNNTVTSTSFCHVVIKISVFWYMTPCSPLKVNRLFGGTFRLHLKPSRQPALCWFLLLLFFDLDDAAICSPKRRLTFCGLHSIIYQETEFVRAFMTLRQIRRAILKVLQAIVLKLFGILSILKMLGARYQKLYYWCCAMHKYPTWSKFLNSIQQNIICAHFVHFSYFSIPNYGSS
jgi:hypothetical protein